MSNKGRGVVETFNGEIAALRRDGYSLQSIGDVIGVTRERVRQILNEYYGGTAIPLLTELQVAKLCGCSYMTIRKLQKQEVANPKIRGKTRYYDRDEVEKIYLALQGRCAMCGEPILLIYKRKYCDKCRTERRRYAYPFYSQEGKNRCMEASRKWQKNHPERTRVIRVRAMKKWQAKERRTHFAETWYEVIRRSDLPVGTVFQAVGCLRSRLLLANGVMIAMGSVKKLKRRDNEKD